MIQDTFVTRLFLLHSCLRVQSPVIMAKHIIYGFVLLTWILISFILLILHTHTHTRIRTQKHTFWIICCFCYSILLSLLPVRQIRAATAKPRDWHSSFLPFTLLILLKTEIRWLFGGLCWRSQAPFVLLIFKSLKKPATPTYITQSVKLVLCRIRRIALSPGNIGEKKKWMYKTLPAHHLCLYFSLCLCVSVPLSNKARGATGYAVQKLQITKNWFKKYFFIAGHFLGYTNTHTHKHTFPGMTIIAILHTHHIFYSAILCHYKPN